MSGGARRDTGVDDNEDGDLTADVGVRAETTMADVSMRIVVTLKDAGLEVVGIERKVILPGLDVAGFVIHINGQPVFVFSFDTVERAQIALGAFTPPADAALFQHGPLVLVMPNAAQIPALEDKLAGVLGATMLGAAAPPAMAPAGDIAGAGPAPAPASTGSAGLLGGMNAGAAFGALLALGMGVALGGRMLMGIIRRR